MIESNMNINSPDYHDFVIKDGRLIGEFEQMYRKVANAPWHQDKQENWIDVRLTVELLRGTGVIERVVDYGCGLGCYLDILVRQLGASVGQGFDISETAVKKASHAYPQYEFQQADLTSADASRWLNITERTGITIHVIRGTLWYVFPKIERVVANLVSRMKHEDVLVVVQNFPPLGSNFVGKDVIPEPNALIQLFSTESVKLENSIWYEKCQDNSNDSWFIGRFKKHV